HLISSHLISGRVAGIVAPPVGSSAGPAAWARNRAARESGSQAFLVADGSGRFSDALRGRAVGHKLDGEARETCDGGVLHGPTAPTTFPTRFAR
ncbi:MAG: hypothetical protein V3V08_09305, partial [Nannocystaceae bacterium]